MFVSLLNKGLGNSLAVMITVFVLGFISHLLSGLALENNQFPDLFYNYFTNKIHSQWLVVLLNYIFIFIGMAMINLIGINQELVDKQNYFPVFFYLLLGISAASPTAVSAQLLTNIFILFSFYQLLSTYREDVALSSIFSAAFWLSVSAFVSISSLFTFPLFFVMLFVLRPVYWRDWVIALLGLCVPLFIYECLAYLSDFNQGYIFNTGILFFKSLRSPYISEYYMPLLLCLLFLFLLAMLQSMSIGFGNTVKKQKTKSLLLWFIFFSLISFFSVGANGSVIIITCSIPLSFIIGDYFFNLKQKKISNTILSIALLCVLLIFLGKLGVI